MEGFEFDCVCWSGFESLQGRFDDAWEQIFNIQGPFELPYHLGHRWPLSPFLLRALESNVGYDSQTSQYKLVTQRLVHY
jgi:hypothetical protein